MAVFTPNPVIGIDISHWNYSINVPLLLEAGVKVFVVKIGQNRILDPYFYKHAENICKYNSQGAILQCYYWDEITSNPLSQAEWLINEIDKSDLPITFTWIDAEQWWTSWTIYNKARAGGIAYSAVPRLTPASLSTHFYQTYMALKNGTSTVTGLEADKCGVYTNNGFILEHAAPMAKWFASEKVNMWIPYYGWQSQPRPATTMTWNTWKTKWFPNYTPPIPAGSSYAQMRGINAPEMLVLYRAYIKTCGISQLRLI